MHDFDYDVLQKKRIARNAQYKRNGSKSRKCPMSTDYMTPKQWRERCGEIVTYKLSEPMDWITFLGAPADIQKEYLTKTIERFGATATDLAKMFKIDARTVSKFCAKPEIGIHFTAGKRMSKENKERFNEFLGIEPIRETEPVAVEEEIAHKTEEAPVPVKAEIPFEPAKTPSMTMTEFSLSFNGVVDVEMIYNSLRSIIPRGSEVKIDILCTVS